MQVRHGAIVVRYQQLGNAVCPLVAAALGRCLAKAAVGASPHGAAVIPVRDEHMEQVQPALMLSIAV